ncbi:MAG TPA: hypothetical protein VJJ24_00495 [Candidatus Paceibacterota bacterium]
MENPTFNNQELVQVIKTERNLRNSVAVYIILGFIFGWRSSFGAVINILATVLVFVAVYKAAKAQKKNAILYTILQIIPIVNIVLIIRLVYHAIKIIKKAGIKYGFWGVKSADLKNLESTPVV